MIDHQYYTPEEQEGIRSEALKFNAYPVFLDSQTLSDSIRCHDSVITPIFHNFVTYKNNASVRDASLIQAYRIMNKEFVDVILSLYNKYPQATILFNDPYFLLAPKIITVILSNLDSQSELAPHMVYFIHCPFPSYEIFRIFPNAREFMKSILCCDIIGFQVYEYARHFFMACHRMLGLEAESRRGGMIGIIYKGRDVLIRVGHVGISKEYTEGIRVTEKYKKELDELKALVKGRTVISSVDKISPISGIKNKLVFYRRLLRQYPMYRGNILLIQYCTPGVKSAFSDESSKETKDLVEEINKEFPDSVVYDELYVSNEKRLALFTISEILLVTSLRDGFCLLPFEFMLAKNSDEFLDGSTGTVILSEFAGCASTMSSISRINPYIIRESVYTILTALKPRTSVASLVSFQHDVKYIEKHDAKFWLESLIKDTKRGHNKNEEALYLGVIDNKILKAGRFFEHLHSSDLQACYAKAVNRVILLDGEGTIFPIRPQAIVQTENTVSVELKQLLEALCANEKNIVYILSGKSKELMNKWFGSVPKLGLLAEYGCYYKLSTENEWETNSIPTGGDWQEKVKELFLWYKERTDGSDLEIKHRSIVWTYKECDKELGNWQSKELEIALKQILVNYPDVSVIRGRGFVEAKMKTLEKGELSRMIINKIIKTRGNIDFVLSMGDDISDEPMFRMVNSLYPMEEQHIGTMDKGCNSFTCIVGRKPTYARYYVNDYKEALGILRSLQIYSIKMARNKSVDYAMDINMQTKEEVNIYSSPIVVFLLSN